MINNTQNGEISMVESSHQYSINIGSSRLKMTSVTETIKRYFNEFNRDVVISQMIDRGTITSNDIGKTIKEWSAATTEGKLLHSAIENYLLVNNQVNNTIDNLIIDKPQHIDLDRFIRFWESRGFTDRGYTVYTELRVYDLDIMISGTIDCLLTNDSGQFIVIDWKRCKNMQETSPNNGKPPFNHLPDCKFTHYSLQLNFYRTIISRKYKINGKTPQCMGMFLVIFPPDHPECVVRKVDYINLRDVWENTITTN